MKIRYSILSLILPLVIPIISSCRAEGVQVAPEHSVKVGPYEAKESGVHSALAGNQQNNSGAPALPRGVSDNAGKKPDSASSAEAPAAVADKHWQNLQKRLIADNIGGSEHNAVFAKFPPYDNKAMAAKVKELYRIKFVRPQKVAVSPDDAKEKKPAIRIYKGIVTSENMVKAKNYLEKHSGFFDNAQKTWGVPPEVAVGLLMLETRLGTYLGSEKALWSLACMAASDSLDDVDDTMQELGVKEEQKPWLEAKVKEKSNWAYNEFKALLRYSNENEIDGCEIPGSVYGAIGYCQFMPSNIKKFGVDADGDGKIDLFTEADAIASLSNFLYAHGWKKDLPRDGKHKVLMCYNRSVVYANTILAVADYLNPPPEGAAKTGAGKKAKAAKPKAVKSKAQAKPVKVVGKKNSGV